MSGRIRVRLEPLGVEFQVERGSDIRQELLPYGVEFPCGGAGTCEGCRVRVLDAAGTRSELACQLYPQEPLTLYVDQWSSPILADDTPVAGGVRVGLGIAVDVGTTTIAAQLVDLATGEVHGVRTALNPQAAFGADVMSRIEFALHDHRLTPIIREAVTGMVNELAGSSALEDIVLVGNTAMHHLFCGLPVDALTAAPFRSPFPGEQAVDLGGRRARFLRCLGGFVGSDILAGIVATGVHTSEQIQLLLDLGTNGEIVAGNRDRLLCASTAAGPAFEGGKISCGMRAATGAISRAYSNGDGEITYEVIGNTEARGICGSGLVDAVSVALASRVVLPSGRLPGKKLPLRDGLFLTQADIRELQLAKGAIAAGVEMLSSQFRTAPSKLYVAGAFGNYIDRGSAEHIGLLPETEASIAAGNTALRGARMLLLNPELDRRLEIEHVELVADADFQDRFAEHIAFPNGVGQA